MRTLEKKKQAGKMIGIDGTLPHQIEAPIFKGTGIQMEPTFKNSHDVIIGDSLYASKNSPLENWSKEIDPAVMAGDEWIHPTNDIGWNTPENKDLLERKKRPNASPFMHPEHDVSRGTD